MINPQVQPGIAVAERLEFGGYKSTSATFVAALGPLFVTVIVAVTVPPAATGSGEESCVMDRSAVCALVTVAVSRATTRTPSAVPAPRRTSPARSTRQLPTMVLIGSPPWAASSHRGGSVSRRAATRL